MSSQLTEAELAALMPSELCAYQTPIPTQIVASDEFYPDPQNERQREVEARLLAMADDLGGKQGLDRRKFFQSADGDLAAMLSRRGKARNHVKARRGQDRNPEHWPFPIDALTLGYQHQQTRQPRPQPRHVPARSS